ncbi:hypothetical protein CEXT_616331 [Caerostris extrusa]|uniref:Uncharacterized protein n=1 Tax=Caerostris extrusa TaxID=172846 RepID=A0AAV4W8E5_CAEEX|nr:hypothetical protein CEXT_616331 [Caerostris extrusa]
MAGGGFKRVLFIPGWNSSRLFLKGSPGRREQWSSIILERKYIPPQYFVISDAIACNLSEMLAHGPKLARDANQENPISKLRLGTVKEGKYFCWRVVSVVCGRRNRA